MHSHGIIQLQGRRGKGSIWVWAAGNGGHLDTCAADGYASSIYTIAIGAANSNGTAAPYDERCSAKMAVVLMEDQFAHIKSKSERLRVVSVDNWILLETLCNITLTSFYQTTTDVENTCTKNFGGTSAACPLASGAIALALEVK